MTKSQLEHTLKTAIQNLITKDSYLLKHDVNERSISAKLAHHLSIEIENVAPAWNVDVEYNRNGIHPKELLTLTNERKSQGKNMKRVVPDIIIHKRGLNNENGTENNNLLIIEIKKKGSGNAYQEDKKFDICKINAFIHEYPYYYKYGVFIEFNNTDYQLCWFTKTYGNI